MGSLTATKIKNLKEPGVYPDGDGLSLYLSKQNRGWWKVRIQINGRRHDIGLGSMILVSLAEAREESVRVRKMVRKGIDPVVERARARLVIPTFKDAAVKVQAELKVGWKNGKHQAQWLQKLQVHVFPYLGKRLVSDIEGPVIRDTLAPIWLSKPETARRVRQRIGVVLDWSYAKGYRSSEAPLRSISRGLPRQKRQNRHFAAMPYEAIPDFMVELRSRLSVGRVALEFLILCASRSGEVRGALSSEISLAKRLWSIPPERMKMEKQHLVPLSSQALDVLDRATLFQVPASNLLFPGQNCLKPMSDMTLLKILRDAEHPYTVHGFRSAFRDWVAEKTDFAGEIAEAALAHSVSNKVEAAYRRTDYLEKRRDLMARWGEFCVSRL